MKFIRSLALPLLFVISMCAVAIAQDSPAVKETRMLESELQLAKKPSLYFIFDFESRAIAFRTRGVTLKEMKIGDMKSWGTSVDPVPRQLVMKKAYNQPKRDEIDPKKEEETAAPATATGTTSGAFDIKALELQDMPTNYRLVFHDNIQLSVRAKPSGIKTRLFGAAGSAAWYISRPILTIWNTYKGLPFTSIYIELEEDDARALYWSIIENSENILYLP